MVLGIHLLFINLEFVSELSTRRGLKCGKPSGVSFLFSFFFFEILGFSLNFHLQPEINWVKQIVVYFILVS